MASVYTKTGDSGETSLYGGTRVSKCSDRVNAYGAVDELNAVLGIAKNSNIERTYKDLLELVQEKLFVIGGELASDENGLKKLTHRIEVKDVAFMESVIDEINRQLPANTQFIKPGESAEAGILHFARTVTRRAEREVIASCESYDLNPCIMQYLNRLSDLLFVLSKVVSEKAEAIVSTKNYEGALSLNRAEKIINRCKEASIEKNIPVVIAIVDKAGHLLHFSRMEDALLGSIDIAVNKAYTSALFKLPTDRLASLSTPDKALYGIQQTNQNRVVIFGGGYPLIIDGKIVGAIGVSGGSVEEDQYIALAGLKILEE